MGVTLHLTISPLASFSLGRIQPLITTSGATTRRLRCRISCWKMGPQFTSLVCCVSQCRSRSNSVITKTILQLCIATIHKQSYWISWLAAVVYLFMVWTLCVILVWNLIIAFHNSVCVSLHLSFSLLSLSDTHTHTHTHTEVFGVLINVNWRGLPQEIKWLRSGPHWAGQYFKLNTSWNDAQPLNYFLSVAIQAD